MIASAAPPLRRFVLPGVIGLAVAAGAVVWMTRDPGPDLSLLPEMQAVTVAPLPFDVRGYRDPGAAPGTARDLWVQRDEVSVTEWNACHADDACDFALPARPGMDPSATPATGLSQPDAERFVIWISARTGHPFRLPDLSEWHAFAAPVLPETSDPIFEDPDLDWASAYLMEEGRSRALRPAGSFSTSPEGIRDLDGTVWEWTRDCYAGSAGQVDPSHCPAYFVGGEHIAAIPYLERDPARGGCAVGTPPAHLGFRLVSDRRPPARD